MCASSRAAPAPGCLAGASSYSTSTDVNAGVLKLGADNVLPSGAGKGAVNVNGGANTSSRGTLNLNGFNLSINGLGGSTGTQLGRVISNASGTSRILTVGNNNASATFPGIIANNTSGTGTVALAKVGNGTQTLTGPNTYTGATIVSGGTLALGASNVLANTTPVSLGTATLRIGAGFTDTTGTLEITGNATIDLGDGASALAFANSSGVTWSGTLNLTGTFVSGAPLGFGTTSTALTTTQLGKISAAGYDYFSLNASGYLIAAELNGSAVAPAVTGVVRDAAGIIQLWATGSNGLPYRLWTTTNLALGDWQLLGTGTVTSSPFVTPHPGASNEPWHFYRFTTP